MGCQSVEVLVDTVAWQKVVDATARVERLHSFLGPLDPLVIRSAFTKARPFRRHPLHGSDGPSFRSGRLGFRLLVGLLVGLLLGLFARLFCIPCGTSAAAPETRHVKDSRDAVVRVGEVLQQGLVGGRDRDRFDELGVARVDRGVESESDRICRSVDCSRGEKSGRARVIACLSSRDG